MTVTKTLQYSSVEFIIAADYIPKTEELSIQSIGIIIKGERQTFVPDAVGTALLEIPGVEQAIENMDWNEVIAGAEWEADQKRRHNKYNIVLSVYEPATKDYL